MKNQVLFYLTFLFIISGVFPQDAVHNYGNIQLHETAKVGFHIDLINDGTIVILFSVMLLHHEICWMLTLSILMMPSIPVQ